MAAALGGPGDAVVAGAPIKRGPAAGGGCAGNGGMMDVEASRKFHGAGAGS